jgi:RND family efflux transporter MFP subunit
MMRGMNLFPPAPFLARRAALAAGVAFVLLAAAGPGAAQPGASAAVEMREVEDVYAADAVIESVHMATVSSQIAGQLTQLHVDAGDRVKRGQLLARIDTREADAQVATSRAQVAQAEAALAQAQLEHDRTKSLVAANFLSQSALDKSEAELKTARAAVDAARAGTAQAAAGRSYAELRAPIDGVVTRRLMELGELATPGRGVVEIHDPATLRAVGTIPQFVLPRTARVDRAEIDLPSLNRRIKAARVTVLPAADPRLLSTQVRADLPADAPAGIVPGTAAKVLVPIGRSQKLVVPAAAVVRRGELTAVFVLADNERRLRQVRVGNRVGNDAYEVLAGLSAGERVALDPVSGRGAI